MTSLINYVAKQFNVSPVQLRYNTKLQKKDLAGARQVCMYFWDGEGLNTKPNNELPFGKDRCTILHAIRMVNIHYEVESAFRAKIDHIREMIKLGEVDTTLDALIVDEPEPEPAENNSVKAVLYEENYLALQV
jgi:hypothetical protein